MAKLVVHAYTKDDNNSSLKTPQELLKTVSDALGGYVAWIDLVDETNATTYKRDEEDIARPMFVIARPINGISINGDEYLLDDDGDVRKFNYEDAVSLCVEHSISLDSIKDINDLDL